MNGLDYFRRWLKIAWLKHCFLRGLTTFLAAYKLLSPTSLPKSRLKIRREELLWRRMNGKV